MENYTEKRFFGEHGEKIVNKEDEVENLEEYIEKHKEIILSLNSENISPEIKELMQSMIGQGYIVASLYTFDFYHIDSNGDFSLVHVDPAEIREMQIKHSGKWSINEINSKLKDVGFDIYYGEHRNPIKEANWKKIRQAQENSQKELENKEK